MLSCGCCGVDVSEGGSVWCGGCVSVLRDVLWGLPEVFERLDGVSVLRSGALDVVRVSGSRGSVSPSVAVDLREEVFGVVWGWEAELCGFLGLLVPDGGSWEVVVTRGTRFLSGWLDRMMERDVGDEFGRRMCGLFSVCLRVLKDGPSRSRLLIPCGWCGVRGLVREEGLAGRAWFTECVTGLGGCGRLFSEDEMEWQTGVRMVMGR